MAGCTSRERNAPARLREGKKILMFVCCRKLQKLEVSFVLELRSLQACKYTPTVFSKLLFFISVKFISNFRTYSTKVTSFGLRSLLTVVESVCI